MDNIINGRGRGAYSVGRGTNFLTCLRGRGMKFQIFRGGGGRKTYSRGEGYGLPLERGRGMKFHLEGGGV